NARSSARRAEAAFRSGRSPERRRDARGHGADVHPQRSRANELDARRAAGRRRSAGNEAYDAAVDDQKARAREAPRRLEGGFMLKTAVHAAIGLAAISSMALAENLSSATALLPPGT